MALIVHMFIRAFSKIAKGLETTRFLKGRLYRSDEVAYDILVSIKYFSKNSEEIGLSECLYGTKPGKDEKQLGFSSCAFCTVRICHVPQNVCL